jgi:hypothetical protein
MHFNTRDLTGQTFGRLTVIELADRRSVRDSHAATCFKISPDSAEP